MRPNKKISIFLLFFLAIIILAFNVKALPINEQITCNPSWSENCYKTASHQNGKFLMKSYYRVRFNYKPDSVDDGWKYGSVIQEFENNWRQISVPAYLLGIETEMPYRNLKKYFSTSYRLVNKTFCRPINQSNLTQEECVNVTEKEFYNWQQLNADSIITIPKGYSAIKYDFEVPKYSSGIFNFTVGVGIATFKLEPVISSCGTISSPGYYTLNQSISSEGTCINIQASNVVLDCQGHSINHSKTTAGKGIYVKKVQNVTIKNCEIIRANVSNEGYGIQFDHVQNSKIENNILKHDRYSIHLYFSDYNLVNNNTIEDFYYFGIGGGYADYNNITNNNISNALHSCSAGIRLDVSTNNLVINNSLSNSYCGILLYANANNNTFINTYMVETYGISLTTNANNNFFENLYLNTSKNARGFYIYSSSNNTVKDAVINTGSDDVMFNGNSGDLYFINVSFNKSEVSYYSANANGTLWVKWYLDVIVKNKQNQPVSNANVTGYDKNNNVAFSELTNSGGQITRQNLTEFIQNASGKFFYTNYTIITKAIGYTPDTEIVNVTNNVVVYIQLEEGLVVVLIAPKNNSRIEKQTTDLQCQATSYLGNLTNLTVRVWNSDGSLVYNKTLNLGDVTNITYNFTFNAPYSDTFEWDCLAFENQLNTEKDAENWFIKVVLNIQNLIENKMLLATLILVVFGTAFIFFYLSTKTESVALQFLFFGLGFLFLISSITGTIFALDSMGLLQLSIEKYISTVLIALGVIFFLFFIITFIIILYKVFNVDKKTKRLKELGLEEW